MGAQGSSMTSRAFIAGCSGVRLTSQEKAFFAESQPWGFILFARNVEAPDQVRALVSELREAVGWNAPVLIDQEGGRVQRLRPPTGRNIRRARLSVHSICRMRRARWKQCA